VLNALSPDLTTLCLLQARSVRTPKQPNRAVARVSPVSSSSYESLRRMKKFIVANPSSESDKRVERDAQLRVNLQRHSKTGYRMTCRCHHCHLRGWKVRLYICSNMIALLHMNTAETLSSICSFALPELTMIKVRFRRTEKAAPSKDFSNSAIKEKDIKRESSQISLRGYRKVK
jgi:hypothetical protein